MSAIHGKRERSYKRETLPIPERTHRCENCDRLYVCRKCTEKFQESIALARSIAGHDRHLALYAEEHESIVNAHGEIYSILPWFCPKCEKAA